MQAYGLTNEPALRKWHALNKEVRLGIIFYESLSCIPAAMLMTDIVIYAESFGVQVGMCKTILIQYGLVALWRNWFGQIWSMAQAHEPQISDCRLDP